VPDDFDSVVADRCRAVDDVAVPADLWSRVQIKVLDRTPVQFSEEETTMIDLDARSRTDEHRKGPRRVLVAGLLAAAAVVAIVLVAIRKDDPVSPADQPSPIVTAPPTTTIATKAIQFDVYNTSIPVTFTAPADAVITGSLTMVPTHWTVDDGWGAHKGAEADIVGVQFAVISNIFADGCQHSPLAPPVGPSVDDLAAAWASLPQYSATPAVDVIVDGYAGKQVGFTVPAFDVSDCRDGVFLLWGVGADPGFYAPVPGGMHIEQRILDVNGTRLLISEYYTPTSSPEDRAALDALLASIQIG
jgi:hypothetical protein